MYFEWNEEKNILLKEARNISFEDIKIWLEKQGKKVSDTEQ